MYKKLSVAAVAAGMFVAGFAVRGAVDPVAHAQGSERVFEMRTYTAAPGKFEALKTRFRDHTTRLFERHGMTNIGYWTPVDEQMSRNTLIYVLAHPDLETAKKNWEAFRSDPEWIKTRTTSEAQGKIVEKVDSMFLTATDYSPLK